MYKIKTSDVALGAAMRFKSTIFDHLNNGNVEMLRAVVYGIYGSGTTDYIILQGCETSVSGSVVTITSGYIFKSGAIYKVNSSSVTLGGGQVVVGTVTVTFPFVGSGDPTLFSDNINHNILEVDTIVFSAGTSGSGSFDLNNAIYLGAFDEQSYNSSNLLADTGTWVVPTTSNFKVSTSPFANTKTININIQFSTISNDTSSVTLLIDNVTFKKTFFGTLFYSNPANAVPRGLAYAECIINTNQIRIKLFDNANIKNTSGSPTFDVFGQITVGV